MNPLEPYLQCPNSSEQTPPPNGKSVVSPIIELHSKPHTYECMKLLGTHLGINQNKPPAYFLLFGKHFHTCQTGLNVGKSNNFMLSLQLSFILLYNSELYSRHNFGFNIYISHYIIYCVREETLSVFSIIISQMSHNVLAAYWEVSR